MYFKRKLVCKIKVKKLDKEQQMKERVCLKMKLSFKKKWNFWKNEWKNYSKLNLKQVVR